MPTLTDHFRTWRRRTAEAVGITRVYERLKVPLRTAVAVHRVLRGQFGHALSVRRLEPVDRTGMPIPWFTYPAIEFIEQLDFSAKRIFEFGAGNSTLFWCERAASVVSVEHNPAWHQRVGARLPANGQMLLVETKPDYAATLGRQPGLFDVIVVDGIERRACCVEAVHKLARGGLIILDNSDWHHRCAEFLRSQDLLEVDMAGFGPINGYTWTTSFFFHREFAFRPRHDRQPRHGLGSLPIREGEA